MGSELPLLPAHGHREKGHAPYFVTYRVFDLLTPLYVAVIVTEVA